MALTDTQKREAATKFYNDWHGIGDEKSDSQRFWIEFFTNVLDVEDVTQKIIFEKRVIIDGQTKFIDVYIPETRVLIEQKSISKELDQKIPQSGGLMMTPFEQGRNYAHWMLPDETPLWIVACNFKSFEIHDMKKPQDPPITIMLEDVRDKLSQFDFMFKKEVKELSHEMEISVKAGQIVGILYDKLLAQYINPDENSLKSLNALCVRLVFCLYAEDAGIFGSKMMFHDYLEPIPVTGMRKALVELFKILDTKIEDRDKYLAEDNPALAAFPYVNGGLFADETIEIPPFNEEIKHLLLVKASSDFDWNDISPTIFGAVFESTLNPETRRSGGMHYTSIENIHKVIDPLFLTELREEFESIKNITVVKIRKTRLQEYRVKLSKINFLDPACGSGNFLTETYLSIRRLENEALKAFSDGQISFGDEKYNPILVSIGQFYGIEINDFAVTVAKTALWIAESQMLKETEDVVHMSIDFLPLKSYANIIEGNAIEIDWNNVIQKTSLHYIMGNPPFVGSSIKSKADAQKRDKALVFGDKQSGKLDYVSCWYQKAADYILGTSIKVAFVSTNSITQGEQVRPLWENLLNSGININFAYRTFDWKSEAADTAHVHCVIIGFWVRSEPHKYLYEDDICKEVNHINGYLVDAPDFYIESRGKAPEGMPKLTQGNKPWDDGGLILSEEERKELIEKYPQLDKYIKVYLGSKDFINNIKRYCLWLVDAEPCDYINIPEIKERFKIVSAIRSASPTVAVQQQANTPYLFSQIRQPDSDYILIPETSTSARRYIPMGFMSKDVIASNSVMTAMNADLYLFGVLESNIHMSWVQTLCGRMKSDYRYSPALYNNFPWPSPTKEQKEKIIKTAQNILDMRAKYPNSSLANLYNPDSMPKPLSDAHIANDRAVMQAYGFWGKLNTKSECIAALMKMYQEKQNEQ
ncbi:DNA methyltransferase [Hespellia stercorisuis]|uniref:site-specific DNA-methyltransferase (adenine-specific) n=1 Tax=Hespellia stercorisuis DSM 15480 TaxID=1121950 RepID=A0A1M6P2C9_9FIRM|nr:DNA methyltransferase [Hespellia stercorisuis]SHK02086.1 Type II restriction/modification system, DNA methylase subunit YeeA [Hespellia stercorisuis DSM 15480]